MPLFFLPPGRWTGPTVTLDAAESHHAAAVLRLQSGTVVGVFDGCGRKATATVSTVTKREVALVLSGEPDMTARPNRLALAVAVPKGSTFDWIVEKAVELGASDIFPLLTQRTIVRLAPNERAERREKWQRTALEACKQCGQTWLPTVHEAAALAPFLERQPASAWDLALVASLQPESQPLAAVSDRRTAETGRPPAHAIALIGPEGDFTPQEYAAIAQAGYSPVSLGALVLRVETAALCTLSMLRYLTQSAPNPQGSNPRQGG